MATRVTSVAPNETKTRIVAHSDIIRITAQLHNAAIDDTVTVDKHPTSRSPSTPASSTAADDRYDNFLITKDCLIMSRDQSIDWLGSPGLS